MATSQEGEWAPVFPEPRPAHWVALVATDAGLSVLSDRPLADSERRWLGQWLASHVRAKPAMGASYVYLGLASGWRDTAPDGRRTSQGVVGVGSGEGFEAPAGAVGSTVDAIVRDAVEILTR